MENFILVVHVLLACAIIGLIMLQQGKGAEAGASFGAGSSATVFGAAGSGNLFSKLTAILVAVFFVTSFALAVVAKKGSEIETDFLAPELIESKEPIETAPATGALDADSADSGASVLEGEAEDANEDDADASSALGD